VSTPIGNLGDVTMRAAETLRACHRVVAEDTRRARQLLSHLGIQGKRVDRFDAHASANQVAHLVERLADEESVALVTTRDAGTERSGEALVRAAITAGAQVVPFRRERRLGRTGRERPGGRGPIPLRRLLAAQRSREASGDRARVRDTRTGHRLRGRESSARDHARSGRRDRGPPGVRRPGAYEDARGDGSGTCAELAEVEREWVGEIAIVLGSHAPEDRAALVDDAVLVARIDEALERGEHVKAARSGWRLGVGGASATSTRCVARKNERATKMPRTPGSA